MTFYTKHCLVIIVGLSAGMAECSAQVEQRPSSQSSPSPAAQDPQSGGAPWPAGATQGNPVEGYASTFPALGTLVQLKAFSKDTPQVELAFQAAVREVRRLESVLTDYDSQSETRQLTDAAFENRMHVSHDLWQVLKASDDWHRRTDGALDSSLGNLTLLWRQHRRAQQAPTASEIIDALADSGWQHVSLDEATQTVQLHGKKIRFDFGAIGKGYIVDRIYELLVEHQLPSCLVNISGNMRVGQVPPGRAGWRIAVSPLEKSGAALREFTCADQAIATSGDLWQYTILDGTRRSHILDPKTGLGVPGPIAATVISKTATDADAFATAACVLGAKRALVLANAFPATELLIATKSDDTVQIAETRDFPK